MPVSYEEYDTSWDPEDQSKKCKRSVNCLLVSCRCKRETAAFEPIRNESGDEVMTVESSQNPTMSVHVFPDMAVEQGRQVGNRYTDMTVQPVLIPGPSSKDTGEHSSTTVGLSTDTTAASSNPAQDTVSQSTRNTRRRNRSWSSSLFRTGLMLLFMFLSITATEGFKDLSEIIPHMYTPDCNLHPQKPIYMMSGKERLPSREMECNLNRSQGVCNVMERYVHKVRDTNLSGVCLQGRLSILEDLHQQPNERARCAQQDQHRVKGYDVALQILRLISPYLKLDIFIEIKPGTIDYDVAHWPVDITNVAVLVQD